MKKRAEIFIRQLAAAVREHPVEVASAFLFACMGCVWYETESRWLSVAVPYFPLFFLLAYILNSLTAGTRWRSVYFLSLFLFIPVPYVQRELNIWEDYHYWVTLAVVQLVYMACDGRRDNVAFFRKGLRYAAAGLSAGVSAGIAWVLSMSVYHSVRYIFEIWQDSSYQRFIVYSLCLAFICVMPLLFLMFNREKEENWGRNRLFQVLLDYVLSPALLIYAVILYIYLIKIMVLWSLPKGAVAFIVTGFVSVLFLLKGCQPFLRKRHYDWFYAYAGRLALPTMILYWVGTFYRINQYGYTQARVYLVAVGVVLTGTVLLFFSRRTGRYLYVALLAVAALSAVTYIPGATAKDIERISQAKRGNYPVEAADTKQAGSCTLRDYSPVGIGGYETLQVVGYNDESEINSRLDSEMFCLRTRDSHILFEMQKDSLFYRQLAKVGLNRFDSIPESAYPAILRLESDSALYVFEYISVYRPAPDSAYRVVDMGRGYYLKKGTPLSVRNAEE